MGVTPRRFEKVLIAAQAKVADELQAVAAGTWCATPRAVSLRRAHQLGILDPLGARARELGEHARACPACRRELQAIAA